jgi:hypothetical protein
MKKEDVMAFEKYEGQRPRGTKNIVSIRKNGQIAFNSKAVQSFNVRNHKFAYLYYDKESERIGIEFSNTKGRGARKITMLGGTALISGSAFLKHFNINIDKAKKFEPEYNENKKMITLDL